MSAPRSTVCSFRPLVEWLKEEGLSQRRTKQLIAQGRIRQIRLSKEGHAVYNVEEVKAVLRKIFSAENHHQQPTNP